VSSAGNARTEEAIISKVMKKVQADKPQVSFADDKKYTVEQVANEHLHKSTKTIYNLIKDRKLKAYRIGREFVITASALNEFAEPKLLEKWFPAFANLDELDPAYQPPEEVDLDSLSDDEFRRAYLLPSELIQNPQNAAEWIEMARLAGLDREGD